MRWKSARRPQRHHEHRGKHMPVSPSDSHRSVTKKRPAPLLGFSLHYNSARSSRAARILPGALATRRPPEKCRRRLGLCPGGTPQEISRGQARASGSSPRWPRRTGHAPAGHRRSFWRRPSRSVSALARRRGQIEPPAIIRNPGPVLRCPAGARRYSRWFPGAASAAADLPPANLLRRPSGTENWPPLKLSRGYAVSAIGARPLQTV